MWCEQACCFFPFSLTHSHLHFHAANLGFRHCLHRTQAITFLIAIQLGLFAALLVASCADLPVLLFGHQVWWLCGVLVPLLSVTLIFSPSVGHLMKLMPGMFG